MITLRRRVETRQDTRFSFNKKLLFTCFDSGSRSTFPTAVLFSHSKRLLFPSLEVPLTCDWLNQRRLAKSASLLCSSSPASALYFGGRLAVCPLYY